VGEPRLERLRVRALDAPAPFAFVDAGGSASATNVPERARGAA
jgi:hypothetical protein